MFKLKNMVGLNGSFLFTQIEKYHLKLFQYNSQSQIYLRCILLSKVKYLLKCILSNDRNQIKILKVIHRTAL